MTHDFPTWFILLGPLLGLVAARLFGRLTWPRALLASALGSAVVSLLAVSLNGGMTGMPRRVYQAGPPESAFTLGWMEYLAVAAGSAVAGAVIGMILYAIVRLAGRLSGRPRATTAGTKSS